MPDLSSIFGGKSREGASRDRLIATYGEAGVRQAEVDVIIQLLFSAGVCRPDEFGELVEKQAKRADDRARERAGGQS